MNRQETLKMSRLKEIIQDNAHVFVDDHSMDEASGVYDFAFRETVEFKFRNTLRNLVEKAQNSRDKYTCETDWESMRFLGKFLEIDDIESNLFSSWVLRVLMEQIVVFFNEIGECHYKIFICWLYQEINIICYNPGVSREQFFDFISKIFNQALIEILKGRGLLPLSNFIQQDTMIGEVKIKLGKMPSNTNCNWLKSLRDMEEEADNVETSKASFDCPFKYHEDSLHAIIKATYRIFGDKVDYSLVQSAFESQDNVLHYTLPYHCRKPRKVKKPVRSEGASMISNFKDKLKQKRKSLKKESLEIPQDVSVSIDSVSILNKICMSEPEFILPLSETFEAYNIIKNNECEEIDV